MHRYWCHGGRCVAMQMHIHFDKRQSWPLYRRHKLLRPLHVRAMRTMLNWENATLTQDIRPIGLAAIHFGCWDGGHYLFDFRSHIHRSLTSFAASDWCKSLNPHKIGPDIARLDGNMNVKLARAWHGMKRKSIDMVILDAMSHMWQINRIFAVNIVSVCVWKGGMGGLKICDFSIFLNLSEYLCEKAN